MITVLHITKARFADARPWVVPERAGWVAGLIAGVLLLAASGCGRSQTGRMEVSGEVSLDGVALDQGVISFRDGAGELPSSEASIIAGVYRIPREKGLMPGLYKVAIDSADPSGATASPTEYSMSIPVSRIPLKYNGESVLTAEVTKGGDNRFDFALESGN
jgi:hypothetical protein